MAKYQDKSEVSHETNEIFDKLYQPGASTPYSGIYICANCRDEVASNKGNPLPPQNHRQHPDTSKPIRWKLLVQSQNGPSA